MERRYELDWLRVLLFGLLVPYHAAVGFASWGFNVYGFANDKLGGPTLEIALYWSHSWRLPALFLVAGMGTYFATRRNSDAGALGRRLSRLLIPAVFGTLTLNLLAGYATAVAQGSPGNILSGSGTWWPPFGPMWVMHLWFLFNLALYTVVCWPMIRLGPKLASTSLSAPILLAALVTGVVLTAIVAKPWIAGRNGSGYQLFWYLGIFAAGFVMGARHESVLDWARRWAWAILLVALATFAARVLILSDILEHSRRLGNALVMGGWAASGQMPFYAPLGVCSAALQALNAWAWMLAALGFAARWLNRPGFRLQSASRAVFPVYVLHYPVVVVGLALLTQTAWPWLVEFLLLTIATYAVTIGLYCLALRTGPFAYLIGGRSSSGPAGFPRRASGKTA